MMVLSSGVLLGPEVGGVVLVWGGPTPTDDAISEFSSWLHKICKIGAGTFPLRSLFLTYVSGEKEGLFSRLRKKSPKPKGETKL